ALGVLVITQQEAARHEFRAAVLSVSFSDEHDEIKLLVAYLEEARRRGASYVSDVAFYVVRGDGGSAEECQASVYPEEEVVDQTVPAEHRFVTCARPVTYL